MLHTNVISGKQKQVGCCLLCDCDTLYFNSLLMRPSYLAIELAQAYKVEICSNALVWGA